MPQKVQYIRCKVEKYVCFLTKLPAKFLKFVYAVIKIITLLKFTLIPVKNNKKLFFLPFFVIYVPLTISI